MKESEVKKVKGLELLSDCVAILGTLALLLLTLFQIFNIFEFIRSNDSVDRVLTNQPVAFYLMAAALLFVNKIRTYTDKVRKMTMVIVSIMLTYTGLMIITFISILLTFLHLV